MTGSYEAHKELLNYVKNHDLRNGEYYDYVCSQVDVDELINYWICESFFNNTDTGNIKYYKVKSDGNWRWVLFDLDWALYPSTWQWNMIEEIVNPNGHGVGKRFDTTLMCGLMRNATFRDKFISRYVECLNTTFKTDRLLEIYDRMIAQIQPEMQMHINKWGVPATFDSWQRNVSTLRNIIEKKTALVRQQLIDTCTNQSGYLPRYFGLSKAEMNKYLEKYE
jgi:spore coat protein CotH